MSIADSVSSVVTHDPKEASLTKQNKINSRLWLKYLAYGFSVTVLAVFAANMLWLASGDNTWELELQRNGVEVYSRKTPGFCIKQYRAVMDTGFTLNQLVAGLIKNANKETCLNSIPGCIDVQVVHPWNSKTLSDTVLWRIALPKPFLPRETLIRSDVQQDPETKVVTVDIFAVPNALPHKPGNIRISHLQNRWTYTPLPAGGVKVEFLQDIDMGGMFPDILLNLAGADEVYKFIYHQLPLLLEKEELLHTHYDFIEEL